jgi:hypothetical protein
LKKPVQDEGGWLGLSFLLGMDGEIGRVRSRETSGKHSGIECGGRDG